MKESLEKAIAEAKHLSIVNSNIKYYVMDKKRGKAQCNSEIIINNPYLYYCVVKEGYYPKCYYLNGNEIHI